MQGLDLLLYVPFLLHFLPNNPPSFNYNYCLYYWYNLHGNMILVLVADNKCKNWMQYLTILCLVTLIEIWQQMARIFSNIPVQCKKGVWTEFSRLRSFSNFLSPHHANHALQYCTAHTADNTNYRQRKLKKKKSSLKSKEFTSVIENLIFGWHFEHHYSNHILKSF